MLCKLMKIVLLLMMLSGFCQQTSANTIMPELAANNVNVPIQISPFGIQTAQSGATSPNFPTRAIPRNNGAVRIALMLPLRSDSLSKAANAVFSGFMAAYEQENKGVTLTLIETGDVPQEVLTDYATALNTNDIVVGPLSRSCVTALVQSGIVTKPTLALTQPDLSTGTDTVPQKMLVIGLSLEDEARQLASWARTESHGNKAFIISTNTAWQRRAAKAFSTQWQQYGLAAQSMEISLNGGYLNVNALLQLKTRIQAEKPALIFAALDAVQVRQMRETLGTELPIYGTSQLNPFTYTDWGGAHTAQDMNDVRLMDIPWQLPTNKTEETIYPRMAVNQDEKQSADMERLYALGIDAYRIAKEIAGKNMYFELNGATGRLAINFGKSGGSFQRVEQSAIYQDGMVMPFDLRR